MVLYLKELKTFLYSLLLLERYLSAHQKLVFSFTSKKFTIEKRDKCTRFETHFLHFTEGFGISDKIRRM